MIFENTHQI